MIRAILVAVFVRLAALPPDWLAVAFAGGLSWLWLLLVLGACCCGGVSGCCGFCTSYPTTYTLTVSGITDGECTLCNEQLNGTFTLRASIFGTVPGTCHWLDHRAAGASCTGEVSADCPNMPTWELGFNNALNRWELIPNMDAAWVGTVYAKDSASWNCTGNNTLTLLTQSTLGCQNWPAALSVIAGATIDNTCDCYWCATSPNQWQFTLSGVTNATCPGSNCTALNATHTLTRTGPCSWLKSMSVCGRTFFLGLALNPGCNLAELFITTDNNFREMNWCIPLSSFNCLGSNVLGNTGCTPVVPPGGFCTSYPASITLSPV